MLNSRANRVEPEQEWGKTKKQKERRKKKRGKKGIFTENACGLWLSASGARRLQG